MSADNSPLNLQGTPPYFNMPDFGKEDIHKFSSRPLVSSFF